MELNNFFIAQIFGLIALIFAIISVFQVKRIGFIIFMILQSLMLCGQYYLLGKMIAFSVCIVSIIRLIVYSLKNKINPVFDIILLIVFTIMNLVISILTFAIWYDIFPLIASTLVCYTIWQKNVMIMKWGLLISKVLWSIYASISLAYFSIILDIFIVIWTMIYIIKSYKSSKKSSNIIC